MNDARTIIHLNVADFAVAVERVLDARLRERPVVIAPEGASRAAVFDMSDEAFQHGIRKGMALARARRLCRTPWSSPRTPIATSRPCAICWPAPCPTRRSSR
jgi:DNA polymerase-4